MQAVKEKFEDMKEMRKVKAEAKAEEKAEKELAKARLDVAHEVRLAKEAEASMEMHVAKAGKKVEKELEKHGVPESNLDEANYLGQSRNTTTATDNTTTYTTTNSVGAPPPTNTHI